MGQGNEDPSTTVDQVRDQVWEAADKTSKALEEGIQAASYVVKSGTVKAREEYVKAMESSQVNWYGYWDRLLWFIWLYLDSFQVQSSSTFRRASLTRELLNTKIWRSKCSTGCEVPDAPRQPLKHYMHSIYIYVGRLTNFYQIVCSTEYVGGVHIAAEHQTATVTALTGLALLILPGSLPADSSFTTLLPHALLRCGTELKTDCTWKQGCLPGPRRFLYRHTFGRLKSEEVCLTDLWYILHGIERL